MVDDPDVRVGADAAHLADCAECQTRLKAVSDDAHSIATLLAVPEAAIDVGLQPPVVAQLPAGVSTTITYGAMSQAEATFTFSAAKAAAAAAAKGKTLPKMPAEMDGATLTIVVGPAVGEVYGNLSQP